MEQGLYFSVVNEKNSFEKQNVSMTYLELQIFLTHFRIIKEQKFNARRIQSFQYEVISFTGLLTIKQRITV